MRRVITLTTDFGLEDGYVGTVKGVILGINPDATLVDICHSIGPQDISQAAFVIGTSYRFFPPGTIHIVAVDPGVGGERRALAMETPAGTFVAPDNGVLSWAVRDRLGGARELSACGKQPIRGSQIRAVSLSNPRYWLAELSRTFHARDVFGPVAAHLSLGVPLDDLGEDVDEISALSLPCPQRRPDGTIVGHVIHVDRFGNLITDLAWADVAPSAGEPIFEIAGYRVVGLSRYYAERPGLLALVGSSGNVEIAFSGGSAAGKLRAGKGATVVMRWIV